MDDIDKFTAENLTPLIGQSFSIKDADNNSVDIILIAINEQPLKGIEGNSFVATFNNPENAITEDASFIFDHTNIGSCTLALSQNSATECEVVVCRLKNPNLVTPPEQEPPEPE